jgi:hypothetical protein
MRNCIDVISAATGERMDAHSISPERGMVVQRNDRLAQWILDTGDMVEMPQF